MSALRPPLRPTREDETPLRDAITRRRALQLGLGGAASVYVAACGGSSGREARPERDDSRLRADAKIEDKLVIGNWVDFQSPENLERFVRATGVKLVKSGYRIQQARKKKDDEVKLLIPEGPAQSYVDLWVIPANAAHPVAAHAFINSVLEPRAAAREMSYTGFGVPVAGVERYEPTLARDPVVSIPEDAIEHYEVAGPYAPDVARKRNAIYTAFKSA